MATKAEWFELYAQAGFQPIAVYKHKKSPVGKNWNTNWSAERWRPYFKIENAYNMGILLGAIVDVEGDTEEANDLLLRMTEDTPHPMFRSSKSTHHLFINPDPDLTRRVFNGMEFRAFKHQSVVPPSIHESGSQYGWLAGSAFKVPTMPEELLRYYESCKKADVSSHSSRPRTKRSKVFVEPIPGRQKVKNGYTRTECKICKCKYYIHKKRLLLEVRAFQELQLPWMCHGCREFDVRESCRVIRAGLHQKSQPLIFPVEVD